MVRRHTPTTSESRATVLSAMRSWHAVSDFATSSDHGLRHIAVASSRVSQRKPRADILILDEFGYVPVDRDSARLLFQVISEDYERQSLVITTNLDFSRWGIVLTDDQMAAEVIDWVAHHGHLIVFEGESYRLRHALIRTKGR